MKKLNNVLNAVYIAITILPLVFSGNQILCGSSLAVDAAYRLYGYYSWAGTYEKLLNKFKGTCFDSYSPQEKKNFLSDLLHAAKKSGKAISPDILRRKLLQELSRSNFDVATDMLELPLFAGVSVGQYVLGIDDELHKLDPCTAYNTPLYQVVVNDNVRFLKTCIRHEGGFNDTIKSKLLSRAICSSSVGCVKELLRRGVELGPASKVIVDKPPHDSRARKVVLLALQYGQSNQLEVFSDVLKRHMCDWYMAYECTCRSDDRQADNLLYDFNLITDKEDKLSVYLAWRHAQRALQKKLDVTSSDLLQNQLQKNEEAKLSVLLAWWHAQRALQKQLDNKSSDLSHNERQEVVAKIDKYNTVFEKLAQGDPSDPVTAFSSLAAVARSHENVVSTKVLHHVRMLINMRYQNEGQSSSNVSLYEGILKEKEGDNRFKGLKKLVARVMPLLKSENERKQMEGLKKLIARVEPGGKDPLGEFIQEKCSNGAKYFAGSVKQGKPFHCSGNKNNLPPDVLHHINGFLYGEASAESTTGSALS